MDNTTQDSQSELDNIIDKHLNEIKAGHDAKLKASIEVYVTTRVKEVAENLVNELISKDAFAEDFEVKELIKTIRTSLTTTTNGKESNE